MTNSEFDKRLSDIVSEETIPYNEDNWELMQQKLDSNKGNDKKLLLLPLLYKKTAAAAVLAATITAWYLYPSQKQNTIVSTSTPSAQTFATPSTKTEITTATESTIINNTNNKQNYTAVSEKEILHNRAEEEQSHYEKRHADSSHIATVNDAPAFQFDKPGFRKERNNGYLPLYDDAPHMQRTVFGINTGMAMYRNHNSFAAGLSISNKLSNRVSISTGIGFVQGQQDVTVKHVTITEEDIIKPSTVDDTVMKITTVSERYEQYSKRLPYLQFNPSISVKVFDKIYATVGADVQRIITSQNTIDTINKHLAEGNKKIATTDFGATASLNYMVTRNIGMGITYRHSLLNKSNDGKEYIKRNYFLVQLQYVFNRKR